MLILFFLSRQQQQVFRSAFFLLVLPRTFFRPDVACVRACMCVRVCFQGSPLPSLYG